MGEIIVDTSGLYAVADRRDPHHAKAARFLRAQSEPRSLIVSNHVFDELMTLIKRRLGAPAALQMGMRLRNSRLVEMVVFTQAEEMATWRIFQKYHDKGWSYTDCACLALAQEREIWEAFTFDHHFEQMGLVSAVKALGRSWR